MNTQWSRVQRRACASRLAGHRADAEHPRQTRALAGAARGTDRAGIPDQLTVLNRAEKTPFVPLEGDAGLEAASLTLASEPIGWAVGDELVLPDTRQMSGRVTP